MTDAPLIQTGISFILSIACGMIIGSERAISNRNNERKRMGMRDFALVAMLAFVSSLFYDKTPMPWIVSFVGVIGFALAAFVIVNLRDTDNNSIGMTTMLALPVTFLVASLPNFDIQFWIIATIVFAMLLMLELKERLHIFIGTLERREVFDFAVLIGIAISITPLVPHSAELPIPLLNFVDGAAEVTYRYIGLSSLWKVVIMVSLMSFVAHFITKYVRGKNALVLATFFGGLVSSLATIMMLLNNSNLQDDKSSTATEAGFTHKGNLSRKEIFLGYVCANTGSIVKDTIIFRLVVGEALFSTFVLPLISALVLFAAISAYTFSAQGKIHSIRITKRPLPLRFIFKFSAMLVVLLIIMQVVTYYMGNEAFILASYLSGLASSAASVTAIGTTMIQEGGIGSNWVIGFSITGALLGSISAKYLVILKHIGLRQSLIFIAPIITMALVMLLTLWIALT